MSQIANIQKQHTIEDEDFDEKTNLISKNSPGEEYCDTLGLFSGLRQDYAWCTGTTPRVGKYRSDGRNMIVLLPIEIKLGYGYSVIV